MTIGERIKEKRKKKGWTQKELASRCDLAEITIRQYEGNKRTPKTEQLQRIAVALCVSINELLGLSYGTVKTTLDSKTAFLNYLFSLGIEYIDNVDAGFPDKNDRGFFIKDKNLTLPLSESEYEKLMRDIQNNIEMKIYQLCENKNL